MAHLQERINMLQQHEANGQCLGGVLCLLQSPIYNAGSLESFLHVRFYGHPHNSPPTPAHQPRYEFLLCFDNCDTPLYNFLLV